VTDKIIADLEQGVRPWVKPWKGGNTDGRITLPVRHNGIPYQGINILLLWGEQLDKGFQSNRWMTFKQAQALSANVRKNLSVNKGMLRSELQASAALERRLDQEASRIVGGDRCFLAAGGATDPATCALTREKVPAQAGRGTTAEASSPSV
ncbi:ArdC-like ssDNA-binding domain-containing protein, partial [Caballeronia calidae]|uniref:ArdC-like ssDNA-binding domain-containing protein n=1 Tax=Caballeronia calidae TaxID=1777139 RepID=UPI001E533B74